MINRPLVDVIDDDNIMEFISQQEPEKQLNGTGQIETELSKYALSRIFKVSLGNLKEEDGMVISNMISIKDITSQKLLEKASQGFIAQVAHEFLAPLTTIGSYNEMLMDGEIEDKEMQKEFYNTISEETGRLSRLIQNLLSLAKMEMGGLMIQKGLVKTDWLVEDTVMTIEGSAQKKNINITSLKNSIGPRNRISWNR